MNFEGFSIILKSEQQTTLIIAFLIQEPFIHISS